MISYIKGIIRSMDKENSKVVVEVNGVGYEILLPVFVMRSVIDRGKKEGDELALETLYWVSDRQPRPILIGFNNSFERQFFEKLLAVEDIGPTKAARAFVFSVSAVANAIESGDSQLLESMPGIGARTARKIIATLKEKVTEFALLKDEGYTSMPSPEKANIRDEAVEILVGLGYTKSEAKMKVKEALERKPEVKETQELIREVFRLEKG